MKNRKYCKAAMAALLTAATILSGCGKELPPEAAQKEEQTGNAAQGGEESVQSSAEEGSSAAIEPEEGAVLLLWTDKKDYGDAVAKAFMEKYPGVSVQAEEVGFTDARKKMELDGPAGSGADVFMISHNRLSSAIASGMVLPFEGDVEERLMTELSDAAIKSASRDGVLYGAPVSVEANSVFYNKDIVGDEPAQSFEEIIKFAEEFNDPAANKFAFMMDVANGYSAYGFLTSFGYQLFGADGTDENAPGFDTPEFVEGLHFFQELKEILPVESQDLKGEFVNEQFKQGKAAYILGGPWNIKDFKSAGVNFGVMPMPSLNGTSPTPFAGLKVAHVSAYTDYPYASMLLAEFMAGEEGANILYDTNYKATALRDISVVPELTKDADLSVFSVQFEHAFPVPNIERMDYYYSISEKTLALVFDGQLEPAEAAEKAMSEWDSLVASE